MKRYRSLLGLAALASTAFALSCSASREPEVRADAAPPPPWIDAGATPDVEAGTVDSPDGGDALLDSSVDGPVTLPDSGDRDARLDSGPSDAATGTIVRVHYPRGKSISLRGSASPLNWDTGMSGTTNGDSVTFQLSSVTSAIEVKPLLDDRTWSIGPNYRVLPDQVTDIYPRFTGTKGTTSVAFTHKSSALGNSRGVWVYLPPSYAENTVARFPVVYMHDAQNLFDAASAFGGTEWQVDEAMDRGAADASVEEAIVVGVENTAARIDELTPTKSPDSSPDAAHPGGKGDLYLAMIVDEIMPIVNQRYRTKTGAANTAIAGSSLGGLISAYAGIARADAFGLVGAFSPSTWWDNQILLSLTDSIATRPTRALKYYVDSGDSGSSKDGMVATAELAARLRKVGYVDGDTLQYVVQQGGQHNEYYWAQRFPAAIAYLLGPRADLR